MNIGGFTLHLARFESVGLGWDAWLDATLETNMNGIDPTVGKVLRPRILLKPVPNFLVLIFWYKIFLTRLSEYIWYIYAT